MNIDELVEGIKDVIAVMEHYPDNSLEGELRDSLQAALDQYEDSLNEGN